MVELNEFSKNVQKPKRLMPKILQCSHAAEKKEAEAAHEEALEKLGLLLCQQPETQGRARLLLLRNSYQFCLSADVLCYPLVAPSECLPAPPQNLLSVKDTLLTDVKTELDAVILDVQSKVKGDIFDYATWQTHTPSQRRTVPSRRWRDR